MKMLVTILAGFATFERHLIKARTDDGNGSDSPFLPALGIPSKIEAYLPDGIGGGARWWERSPQ
jgi:hypothetical protein